MKFDDEVHKQLEAVVGESYRPARSWRRTLLELLAAAVLAIGTSALIIGILDKHVGDAKSHAAAQGASPPEKPVAVTIVPGK